MYISIIENTSTEENTVGLGHTPFPPTHTQAIQIGLALGFSAGTNNRKDKIPMNGKQGH